jgi:hypothetical protein
MKFVVLFEDHPDAGTDVRRNHMSEQLAFLERNSHKVNAAGPLKAPGAQVLAASGSSTRMTPAGSINWSGRIHFWPTGLGESVRILLWNQVYAAGSASTWFDGRC